MMAQQSGQSQVICNGVCAPCLSSVLTLCFSVFLCVLSASLCGRSGHYCPVRELELLRITAELLRKTQRLLPKTQGGLTVRWISSSSELLKHLGRNLCSRQLAALLETKDLGVLARVPLPVSDEKVCAGSNPASS